MDFPTNTWPIHRRRFLKTSLALGISSLPQTARAHSCSGRNDRINVALVGLGSRGFNLLNGFLKHPRTQVVGICDVAEIHYRDNVWGKGTAFGRSAGQQRVEKAYANSKSGTASKGLLVVADYRELVSREDVDVVVVATPDHWHALCSLAAINAGKDVYCEKPVTHTFSEGQRIYQSVTERNIVFQTGSQQRSNHLFRRAVELVHNGHLGELSRIEVGLPPGYDVPQGNTELLKAPDTIDYEMWTGPAPMLPYMRARHHRWWRGNRAYGGGVLMDWIGHHNDIAHWAMGVDRSGPQKVEAVKWRYPATDVYDTPEHYEIRCEYSGGIETRIGTTLEPGTTIHGSDGWLHVDRGRLTASDKRWSTPGFVPGKVLAYKSDNHIDNFIACVQNRTECIAPAETAHRSITPGHLGYVSHQLQRPLRWDPQSEKVVGDAEANELLQSAGYRAPWSLERA